MVAIMDGVGGPKNAVKAADGLMAGPTDKGTFTVASCGQHSSKLYATWSKIRWGSPLKEENGQVMVQHEGKWQPLSDVTPLTKENLLDYYELLYEKRQLPDKWLFNDFGHQTCYLFKDTDGDGKLGKKEKIHAEFFHTTPQDEASEALGKKYTLSESHGCVHVRPPDLDLLVKKGYLKPGTKVVVHGYEEKLLPQAVSPGKAPYEVHFYPGEKKIVVYGERQR
jgi:hypothetical protein